MNIGTITYKNYVEHVLLNRSFNAQELFKIILDDMDFIKFEIHDNKNNLLLSTHYPDIEHRGTYLNVLAVKKEIEITGTTYNAYHTPTLVHRVKIRWNVDGARFRVKKRAHEYAQYHNKKSASKIAQFIIDKEN